MKAGIVTQYRGSRIGIVGFTSYLLLIGSFLLLFIQQLKSTNLILAGLVAGFVSMLITNFFGFSTVPVAILFFLFPAIAYSIDKEPDAKTRFNLFQAKKSQKLSISIIILITILLQTLIARYWYADFIYNKAKVLNVKKEYEQAMIYITSAINISPNEALYYKEASDSATEIAIDHADKTMDSLAIKWINKAIDYTDKAIFLSPRNLIILKNKFKVYLNLSYINPDYMLDATKALEDVALLAPTDAKNYYNLGLIYSRRNKADLALATMQKAVNLKRNYKEARFALALLLSNKGDNLEAVKHLEYILENIDTGDELVKFQLDELTN